MPNWQPPREFSARDFRAFRPVSHVIFQMDGLLLDTERLYLAGINRILARFGGKLMWNQYLETFQTLFGRRHKVEVLVKSLNLPISSEQFMSEWAGHCEELLPQAGFMPGVELILRHLNIYQIPFAIMDMTSTKNFLWKTRYLRDGEMFGRSFRHCFVCKSNTDDGRDTSGVFLRAFEHFKEQPEPSQCLVFVNSASSVDAVLDAGMQVVMVPDARLPLHLTDKATLAIEDFERFNPECFGLPPFNLYISDISKVPKFQFNQYKKLHFH